MLARLGCAIGLIGLAWAGAPASAQPTLCARLTVPEGLELDCVLQSDAAGAGLAAVVQPTDSEFAPLSELRLRRVEEPVEDPAAWLREQLTLDLTPLDAALAELTRDPDSPITGTGLAEQLESWRGLLGSAAALPLSGCDDPARLPREGAWEMACEWELGPLRQLMRFRLIERDGERHAITIRTMNEQRLRHLVAIANSFESDSR
jgi:hypothetical protein